MSDEAELKMSFFFPIPPSLSIFLYLKKIFKSGSMYGIILSFDAP